MNQYYDLSGFRPTHFELKELFPNDLIMNYSSKFLWKLFDTRILISLESLRTNLDRPIIVNYGNNRLRGFRPFNCHIGATFSQHKFGRAIDLDVKDMTAAEVRNYIIENQNLYPYITRLENNVSWVHIDCCAIEQTSTSKGIYLFKPM